MINSLGTNLPCFTYVSASLPSLVCFSIFERNISPGEMCTKSNFSTMRLDIVPFPEAGGPKITARILAGVVDINRSSIFQRNFHCFYWNNQNYILLVNTSKMDKEWEIYNSVDVLPFDHKFLNVRQILRVYHHHVLLNPPLLRHLYQLPVLDFLSQSSLDDLFDEFLLLLEFDVNDDDDLSGLYPGRCQVRLVWRAGGRWLCEGLREICLRYLCERRVDGERLWRLRGDGVPLGTKENFAGSGLIDGGGGGTWVLPNPMILKLDVEVVDFVDDEFTSLVHMRIDGALGGGVSDFSRFFTAVSVGIAAALLCLQHKLFFSWDLPELSDPEAELDSVAFDSLLDNEGGLALCFCASSPVHRGLTTMGAEDIELFERITIAYIISPGCNDSKTRRNIFVLSCLWGITIS
uniref:Uncharacterized protein n=1 Tax=Glossina pallidipes TaxID=7398 RepID=A0A1A9Z9X5_GLOPL